MFPAENTVHIELLFNLKNKSNISCDDVGHRFVQEFRLNEQSVIYIIIRRPVGLTDQANPSCFCFRIS